MSRIFDSVAAVRDASSLFGTLRPIFFFFVTFAQAPPGVTPRLVSIEHMARISCVAKNAAVASIQFAFDTALLDWPSAGHAP